MADEERYEADRREVDVREGDGDEGNGRDELPPFTPEQLQWIDRILIARQMQQTQDRLRAAGSSAAALHPVSVLTISYTGGHTRTLWYRSQYS